MTPALFVVTGPSGNRGRLRVGARVEGLRAQRDADGVLTIHARIPSHADRYAGLEFVDLAAVVLRAENEAARRMLPRRRR